MIIKKTSKNRIALPKTLLDKLPNIDYFEVRLRGDEIVLKPVRIEASHARLSKVRAKIKVLGLTEKDVDEAIRWARDR